MIELTSNERYNILNNYKHFSENDLQYWYNRLNERMAYLKPLLDEIKIKKLDLRIICKELEQEVFENSELLKFLELFKNEKV